MTKSVIQFAAIGECMLELKHTSPVIFSMSFGGDTYNVTLYLARYQQQLNLKASYITALGDDPYSNMMLSAWQQEGIDTHLVQRFKNRLPGLYIIRTDEHGERKFYYYRSQSPARELFYSKNIKFILQQLMHYEYLYFSGISLAILDTHSRTILLKFLTQIRKQGAKVVFDTNYRPTLWEKKTVAKKWIGQALKIADIVLTTWEDEQKLFGDKNPQSCLQRIKRARVKEIVIKRGPETALVFAAGEMNEVSAQVVPQVVDTTAAGDSFNAAYLAARIKGFPPIEATASAHQLASIVITHSGAIIPKDAMPKII